MTTRLDFAMGPAATMLSALEQGLTAVQCEDDGLDGDLVDWYTDSADTLGGLADRDIP